MTANHRALEASDIALIETVKGSPTLYDSSHPDFKFAYRKEQLWENVSLKQGMTAVDARRRWTCLRDRYSRELKQMRLHPEKREYGNNDFFKQMDFLRKFVRKRRERRRVESTKYKYESSWDGSADDASKMHKTEQTTTQTSEDMYEESQEQYNAKLEASGAEESYSEFVEVDGQINDSYEEYVEQAQAETVEEGAQTTRDVAGSGGGNSSSNSIVPIALNNEMPVAFIKHQHGAFAAAVNYASTPRPHEQPTPQQHATELPAVAAGVEPEDEYFCKTIGSYLRQLSRRHKIKAKVEMFQILDKYIELEENSNAFTEDRKG